MSYAHLFCAQANVEYSSEKLAEFKTYSQWYDPLTFCEPSFLVGNALLMSPGSVCPCSLVIT